MKPVLATAAASLTLLLAAPAFAQTRETITLWEFPGYAARIFREDSQYKINLYNRQTRILELNAAPITREITADGTTYRHQGQFDINIFVANEVIEQPVTESEPVTGDEQMTESEPVTDNEDLGPTIDGPLGNCGNLTCSNLLNSLEQQFPEQVSKWTSSCTNDLALNVFRRDGSQRVNFLCWEPPSSTGERSGSPLGVLPYPGAEAAFPVAIASDDPAIQTILDRNPKAVQTMGFDCAVQGGDINILANETAITLQCYFQAGIQTLDTDGDGVSDGELSMGAGVDFTRAIPRTLSES